MHIVLKNIYLQKGDLKNVNIILFLNDSNKQVLTHI